MIIKGSRCPKCNREIVYDGNYYCQYINEDCNWVMPGGEGPRGMTKKDRDYFVLVYVMLMKQLGREPAREVLEDYV